MKYIYFLLNQHAAPLSLYSRFVLMHLPGKITYKEIDEMITTVDKNEDWKISYSEFRVKFLPIQSIKYNFSFLKFLYNQN